MVWPLGASCRYCRATAQAPGAELIGVEEPAPVGQGWMNDDGIVVGPDRIDGQRVEFCVTADARRPDQELTYLARVVDPGSYTWEPAVLQSSVLPDQGVVTPATMVTITPAGS